MNSSQTADLCILIVTVSMFVAYHLWYFYLRGKRWCFPNTRFVGLWETARKTRSLWVDLMEDDSREAIVAVQTVRNLVIAVSLLSAAEASMATVLIQVLTDSARLDQLTQYAREDPISGGGYLVSPPVKVALALGCLLLSLLIFSQSVRMAVHLGFLIRVVPAHPHINLPLRGESIILMQRASLCFTLGLRLLYLFIPAVMYILGSTALLISMILLLLALFFLDQVPVQHPKRLTRTCTAFIEAHPSVRSDTSADTQQQNRSNMVLAPAPHKSPSQRGAPAEDGSGSPQQPWSEAGGTLPRVSEEDAPPV